MDSFQNFLKRYHTKSYPKREIILAEGETPRYAYVIKKGIIKTYNLTQDGVEKPVSFDTEGEVFPAGWIFGKLHHTHYFYEAFTPCELYLIPRDEYQNFILKNHEVLQYSYDRLMGEYLNFQMRVYSLEQSKAGEKVLHTLHFLSHRFGQHLKGNIVQLIVPLTQQDMANFMGLTRETTSIELKRLERQGVISHDHQTYLIHTNKLKELLGEDYGSAQKK
jgi:CRP-like cAMP-binding protein